MKTTVFLALMLLPVLPSLAQLSAEQRMQDSVVGWWSNPRYDKLKPATDALGKRKTENLNRFVEWMKKSYTPVAGLGTSSRYIGKNGYGVSFLVWNVSHDKRWLDEKGHFRPIPEENTPFWVATNMVFGAFTIEFIQKSGKNMFTMQPDGYAKGDWVVKKRKGTDPRIHPNAHNYITWLNEWNTVYLAPGNKMPLVAVTKGELLQAAEDALESVAAEEKKTIASQWPNNLKAQEEAFESRKKNIDSYRVKIQALRDKHRATLNEPAVVRDMQVSMYSFGTDPDIFTPDKLQLEQKHYYPVYKIDPTLESRLGDEKPLWVAIAFPPETKEDGNQLYEMYTALSQNFNYEYVYNYFFDPEKVKGKPYVPANEEQLKARLNAFRERGKAAIQPVSNASKLTGNQVFFDDFSAGAAGGDPVNWFFRKQSAHAVLTKIPGQSGNWLQLGYFNPIWPTPDALPAAAQLYAGI
ncbi:hypothetical protein [Larkinella terrae]|uniref:Uncharacterized protein n=1 Tax=Larkinella terrae TaxID=2025311 RepID=A0A7K0EM67_9BACT|nr:hypothetical protein [Larkinella terrae]MRS62894.1 hypothetical protein [Larkinella terrae]